MPKHHMISNYRFDPAGPFVATRAITLNGQTFGHGEEIPTEVSNHVNPRKLRQMYEHRRIAYLPPEETASEQPPQQVEAADPVDPDESNDENSDGDPGANEGVVDHGFEVVQIGEKFGVAKDGEVVVDDLEEAEAQAFVDERDAETIDPPADEE